MLRENDEISKYSLQREKDKALKQEETSISKLHTNRNVSGWFVEKDTKVTENKHSRREVKETKAIPIRGKYNQREDVGLGGEIKKCKIKLIVKVTHKNGLDRW